MNITKTQLFGTNITIIGSIHNTVGGTTEEDMYKQLSRLRPDLILVEYPEKGVPNFSIDDIPYGDVKGVLSYCEDTNTNYKPIDKYIENHGSSTLKSETTPEVREKIRNSSGKDVRKLIFKHTNTFSEQVNEREQNMMKNIISYSGQYNNICFVVGDSHVQGIKNEIESLSYI